MTRRTEIMVTLDKVRAAKILVTRQIEFINLAKSIGYQPVQSEKALERFRQQLDGHREELKRLTQQQLAWRSRLASARAGNIRAGRWPLGQSPGAAPRPGQSNPESRHGCKDPRR
jgi:hypothetical protein